MAINIINIDSGRENVLVDSFSVNISGEGAINYLEHLMFLDDVDEVEINDCGGFIWVQDYNSIIAGVLCGHGLAFSFTPLCDMRQQENGYFEDKINNKFAEYKKQLSKDLSNGN